MLSNENTLMPQHANTHTRRAHSLRLIVHRVQCIPPAVIMSANRISIFFSFAMIAASQPANLIPCDEAYYNEIIRILIRQCHWNGFEPVRARVSDLQNYACIISGYGLSIHRHAHTSSSKATTRIAPFNAWFTAIFHTMALTSTL